MLYIKLDWTSSTLGIVQSWSLSGSALKILSPFALLYDIKLFQPVNQVSNKLGS